MPVSWSYQELQSAVLAEVRGLLQELGSARTAERASLESSLDRDLGLGSLERVELLVRLERRIGSRLPESGAQTAETPGDWARIALNSRDGAAGSSRWPIVQPHGEAHPPPEEAAAFTQVLLRQAERDPARVHVHLLDQDSGQDVSYGQLHTSAARVAAGLVSSGLQAGETVAIMLPTCMDFFSSFLGVMLAGGIAVPVYPPTRPNQLEAYIERQALILRNAGVRFLISFDQVRVVASILEGKVPEMREVVGAPQLAARGRHAQSVDRKPAEIFFIQYTSGSTGDPKGVTLTHSNVLANIRGIGHAVQAKPSDTVVSWLPLYHDMGLIGSWLFSLYYGFPITVLSPLDFLVRPERWLWALSDSRGTLCPAPNFAFELCMRKITDEALEGIDLSSWRVAINAGEPVLPSTLKRFAERYGRLGFDSRSFMPFYGLAESTVALTYPPYWRGPLVDSIERIAFETDGRAVPAKGSSSRDVLRFVANGRPLPGHEIRIVDEGRNPLPDRTRGRILFRGPCRTDGYFRNPEATEAVLDGDGWMDSGDLGYVADGELYVTGRMKDCIIKGGRNIIPQDVEMAAWEVDGVRKGCVAAFGCADSATGTEKLVVVSETRVTDPARLERMRAGVTETVALRVGIPPDDVALAHPGFIPKTSSGKIRRVETRKLYEQGAVTLRPSTAVWVQIARVWTGGTVWSMARAANILGPRAYGGVMDLLGNSLATVCGLVSRLAPSPASARYLIAPAARAVTWLAGTRTRSELNGDMPGVILANRSNRLDPLLIAAACRHPFVFSDRTGFADLGAAHAFLLEPLLARAVGDGSGSDGGVSLERIQAALRSGCSVVSLADNPIGEPIDRTRFRAESFAAAARSDAAVTPLLLRTAANGSMSAVLGRSIHDAGAADLAENRQAVRKGLNRAAGYVPE